MSMGEHRHIINLIDITYASQSVSCSSDHVSMIKKSGGGELVLEPSMNLIMLTAVLWKRCGKMARLSETAIMDLPRGECESDAPTRAVEVRVAGAAVGPVRPH